MKKRDFIARALHQEHGAVLVLVALLMFVFIGITALAIDLGHLYVVRNELQNAADAGALAGAGNLYSHAPVAGLQILASANQVAYDTAIQNNSENLPVEVHWTGGNTGDVQRGHWSFSEKMFTPVDSLIPISLAGVSTAQLDIMDGTTAARSPAFVNAVKATSRRETNPAASFFAQIFGYDSFVRTAEAVAYIGFAGKLEPEEVDQPIAICQESIRQLDGTYDCNIGRMINSSGNVANSETGGWTDFNQDSPCLGGTNALDVRNLVCSSGNPAALDFGELMATNGGQINTAFHDLIACWQQHLTDNGDVPWKLTLPVVTCPGNNVSTCETLVGAVTLYIVWINDTVDPLYNDAPTQMGDWSNSDPDGSVRWQSFVQTFNLQNVDGTPAPYNQKSIYFLPSCEVHEPRGHTGGVNFGVLAKYPVLVK